MRKLRFTILILLLAVLSCSEKRATATLHFDNPDGSSSPQITAELALTESQRLVGLMYRKKLGGNAGMLFIYPQEKMQSFWMKNTAISLDIIFMDKDFKVGNIIANTVPYSENGLLSKKPSVYVLEIRAGKSKEWGIVDGSVLRSSSVLPSAQ